MARKRKAPLPKITDFISVTSSRTERESAEESIEALAAAPAQRSKHHDRYNSKWEEFTCLRYIPADQEDGPGLLCTLCKKHNEDGLAFHSMQVFPEA